MSVLGPRSVLLHMVLADSLYQLSLLAFGKTPSREASAANGRRQLPAEEWDRAEDPVCSEADLTSLEAQERPQSWLTP